MDELVEFIVNNIDVYDFNKYDLRDAINKYYNENYDKDLLDEILSISIIMRTTIKIYWMKSLLLSKKT